MAETVSSEFRAKRVSGPVTTRCSSKVDFLWRRPASIGYLIELYNEYEKMKMVYHEENNEEEEEMMTRMIKKTMTPNRLDRHHPSGPNP